MQALKMWNKPLALSLVVLLAPALAWAKKEMIILGGGGDPPGQTTIFDQTLQNLGAFSLENNWNPSVVFDGGHSATERLSKLVGGAKAKTATTANMKQQIAELKARIAKGELTSGDQVMMTIATHGYPAEASVKSHGVSSTDGMFNLDELASLRDLAEKKGVNLAILDFSCHSGNSLKLSSDKTCVISAASTNIGYNNAGEQIAAHMKSGLNLEQVYAQARMSLGIRSPGTPQISTEAGKKAYEMTEFLSQSMKERVSLDLAMEGPAQSCGLNTKQYTKLRKALDEIAKNQSAQAATPPNLGVAGITKSLEDAMKIYEVKRKQAEAAYKGMTKGDKEVCLKLQPNQDYCGTYTQFEYGYHLLQEQAKGNPKAVSSFEMNAYRKFVASADYKKWQTNKLTYEKIKEDIYDQAAAVADAERLVYRELYNHYSANSKAPNPCRNFIL